LAEGATIRGVEQRVDRVRLGDGTEVGFAVAGRGPVLVCAPGWVSHLELGWALPVERRFYEALADGRRLVRYDRPGCGMSGPAPDGALAEVELEVIEAVTRAVGADRFDLLGTSASAPLAVRWASSHPETVRRLVLYGGWVDGRRLGPSGVREHVLGLVEQHWGLGSEVLTDIFAPGVDAGFRAAFAAHQRDSASAETARRMLAAGYELDVSDDLARVRAPTAVIHREGDRAVPLAEGQRLAAGIDGASLTVLPGRAHVAFAGDVDALVDAIRQGLGLPPVKRRFEPALTPRQMEVAALVSEGLSNRQIAERLVITERSAESHVERIRGRLDFRSRAQIAAWYVATRP
jgi:pimeloyl-ACP methyl ester carboxylesterase/DNA-binding CsgD family transcriptional regulator